MNRHCIDVLFIILDVEFMLENAPVLQTQVGEQLLAIQRAGLNPALLTTVQDRARFEAVVGRRLREEGIDIFLIPSGGRVANLARVARATRTVVLSHEVRHVYSRGIWGPVTLFLAGMFKKIPFVYDVRGALVDETRGAGSASWKAIVFSRIERWCVRGAMRVTTVSTWLAEEIKRSYGRAEVTVIPSCVHTRSMMVPAEEVVNTRVALGVRPSELLLIYSGGLDYYQQIPRMLELWRQLLDEPDVRFLLLTNAAPHQPGGEALRALAQLGDRVRHLSVPRSEIPRYLASGDLGFMLRDSRLLNRTASPVKFAEYVAAGLAVVASPGTGDVSSHIEEHDLGTLVSVEDLTDGISRVRQLLNKLRRERATIRQRAIRLAAARYDWDAYLPTYREIYGASSTAS